MEGIDLVVGGVALIPLVLGLTQLVKEWFSLEGKYVKVASFVIAVLVITVVELIQFLPPEYGKIVETVLGVIAFSLASNGLYQIGSDFASRVAK